MTAAEIAEALGGRPSGSGFACPCPVPGHGRGGGDRHPSLSVADGDDGLLVHCFAGCDSRDVIAELQRQGLIDCRPWVGPLTLTRRRTAPRRRPCPPTPSQVALALWRNARPRGEVVARYLGRRGITCVPPSLRQGMITWRGDVETPTMVAAVQGSDRRLLAVQTLRLTWDARQAPLDLKRITTGKLYDGAVRLAAAAEVLGLAEGIETALAAMQLTGLPVWASLGAQRLGAITLPPIVRELHIFADDDEPGRHCARLAGERFARRRVSVRVRLPPEGCGDWADYLLARAAMAQS